MPILTNSQTSRLLDIAYAIAHEGQITEANAIFNAFLKEDSKHVPSLIGLGLTNIMIDKFDEGEAYLKQVLDENPNNSEALAILSLGYFINNKNQEAKEAALKVQELSSNSETEVLAKEILEQVS